ncbi:hypothetical protein Acr_05g0004750 [Actinidia rufa]|uniref:F-box associated domain-containing protein n=1 Tax=Actinidia rufa TaxID=165716 RepID=A0A7J0EKU3_9ERIC|nr:hypothetical protein Acr_05g0004750 [Actinidia rufa]
MTGNPSVDRITPLYASFVFVRRSYSGQSPNTGSLSAVEESLDEEAVVVLGGVIVWWRVMKNHHCLLVKRLLHGGGDDGCVAVVLSLVPNETPVRDLDVSFMGLEIWVLQLLVDCFCTPSSCTSWNGDFYWYGYRYGRDPVIIGFSMTQEVFDEMPVPEVCLLDEYSEKKLLVLNNSLAMVIYPNQFSIESYEPEKCFDIWVMNEYDMSWTKIFTV